MKRALPPLLALLLAPAALAQDPTVDSLEEPAEAPADSGEAADEADDSGDEPRASDRPPAPAATDGDDEGVGRTPPPGAAEAGAGDEPAPADDNYGKLPAKGKNPDFAQWDGAMPVADLGGRFMDTRLSFSLSDDNFLRGPGQTTPSSPFLDFSPRSSNQLFFDNLNRRDTGYETLSHMVLHRRQKGFLPGMDSEAAIVARFRFFSNDTTGRLGSSFGDDGSYLRMRYFFSGSVADERAPHLDLVMFPFNSDRFRLGYLYDISWGGLPIFPARNVAAPGAKLQLNVYDGYFYVGAKTARLLDEDINEIEANWGGMVGAGYDFFDLVSVEMGGGVFQRGTNPLAGVEGEPVIGYGGSARVAFHYNRSVPGSVDFRLYRADPAMADLFNITRKARRGFSFLAAAEYSHLQHTLQDPGNARSTKLQFANASAISMRFGWDNLEIGADGVYRDLSFILFNRPSMVPFQDFPRDSIVTPEFMTALSASWFFEKLHLTPGIVVGVQMPATFAGLEPGTLGSAKVEDYSKAQVVVVRNINSVDILPCNAFEEEGSLRNCVRPQAAEPIYALRMALKWDISEILAIVGEATFFVDNNETDLTDDAGGIITRQRVSNVELPTWLFVGTSGPHNVRLGAGIFAQARF